jgi:hypothetical protein
MIVAVKHFDPSGSCVIGVSIRIVEQGDARNRRDCFTWNRRRAPAIRDLGRS